MDDENTDSVTSENSGESVTEVTVVVDPPDSSTVTPDDSGAVIAAAIAGGASAVADNAQRTAENAEQTAQENAQEIQQVKEEQETWQATTQKILSELAQGQQVLMSGLTALAETVREMVTKMSPQASPQTQSVEGAAQERTVEVPPAQAPESVVTEVAASAAQKVEEWI